MATDSADNKVQLAVFGKHPGWDDHIEEIGLDVPELVTARRLLYSEGVAGNIDSGAWDRLEEGKLLPAFKHNFYWRIGGRWIVGRLWSSRDGKGRSKYPMIVCGRIDGASVTSAARSIVPALMRFEEAVKATALAEDVKQAAAVARAELVRAVPNVTSGDAAGSDLLRRLVDHPNLNPGGDPTVAFERVMYEIEREMQGFRRQSAISRAKQEPSGQHIRVPRCFDEAGESAQAWTALLDRNIDASTAVLVIEPDDADFVDVLVGAPAVGHIFCLRANRQGLGLSTEVPYTIDSDFAALVRAKRESYRKNSRAAEPNRSVGVEGQRAPSKAKWFVVAGVGLVGVIAGIVALSGDEKPALEKTPRKDSTQSAPIEAPAREDSKPVEPNVVEKPEPTSKVETPTANPARDATANGQSQGRKPDAPRRFDPSDPRASWRASDRLAELNARHVARSEVHAADAPRESSAARDLLRDAQDILDEAMELEYPQGRITIEFTMKKLDDRIVDIETAVAALDERIIASAKSAGVAPELTNTALAEAWRKWYSTLDFSKGSIAVRASVEQANGIFERIDRELSRAPGALSVASGFDPEPMRAQAAASAAESASKGDLDSALHFAGDFIALAESVESLAVKANALKQLLASGVLPGERSSGGATIEGLVAEIRASESLAVAHGAFDRTLASADGLLAIDTSVDTNNLLQHIAGGGSSSLAAMIRLGAPEVRINATQLAAVADSYVGSVSAALDAIADLPRRERVSALVLESARQAWVRACPALGADDEGLDALEKLSISLGDDPWAAVTAEVRFNRALRRLRASEDSKAGDAAAEVLMRGDELSAENRAGVASLLDSLKALKPVRKMLDFSQVGPATAGWKVVESDESRVVYEKGSRGGSPVRLEFRALTTASGAKSMVLTTEVSVRMASIMVQDANALTSKVAAMVGWRFSGESTDSRVGPRTWTWTGAEPALELIPVNSSGVGQGWLRGAEGWIGSSLAASNPKPNWDSPMQYVGISGALLFARAAGCGLPTMEEYTLAAATEAVSGSNLRDSSWSNVVGVWLAANPSGTATCPANADSYSGSVAAGSSPSLVRTDSDGVVWFDRVDAGGGAFRNIVGNVAEYVVDSAEQMQVLAAKPVESLLRVRDVPVMIVGSSSLSGPESKPEEGVRLNPISARGYSDVGFRLAFGLGAAEGPMEWDVSALRRAAAGDFYRETR